MPYAVQTSVNTEQSQLQIERMLKKCGAKEFGFVKNEDMVIVMFTIEQLTIKMTLALPEPQTVKFTPTGKERSNGSYKEAYDQLLRQRWRALLLVVKAKLEAVECGISTLEREFLSDVVVPGGATVYETVKPQLETMAATGRASPPHDRAIMNIVKGSDILQTPMLQPPEQHLIIIDDLVGGVVKVSCTCGWQAPSGVDVDLGAKLHRHHTASASVL